MDKQAVLHSSDLSVNFNFASLKFLVLTVIKQQQESKDFHSLWYQRGKGLPIV